jgi:Fe-S cluster assembly protein SufD
MSALALPSTHEEAWRWSDLSVLPDLADAQPQGGVIDTSALWIGSGPRLLFVDGVLDAAMSEPGPLVIGPVDSETTHPLGRLAKGEGWTLALGPDHATPALVEIVHVSTGGASHLPARIALEEDAQASIVETFIGDGWANRLVRIDLGASARLMRAVRLIQGSGFSSIREEATLDHGASLVTTFLGAGGAGTRIDAAIDLAGPGAYAEYGGALLARGEQRHDAAIVVRHDAENGTSRQLWRAVADDSATASMAARVEVARGAQKTDGEQSLRGLLLKRSATVNLKPELEIFADDVKCAHGATVGELDARALFYLQSRGIPPETARAMLTRAFIADALERIGEEAVREVFIRTADEWLSSEPLVSSEVETRPSTSLGTSGG